MAAAAPVFRLHITCSERKDAPCRNVVYEDYLKAIVLDQIKTLFNLLPVRKTLSVVCVRDEMKDPLSSPTRRD